MVRQSTKNKHVGKVFPTNKCGDVKILEVFPKSRCKVIFLENGQERLTWLDCVARGQVRYESSYFGTRSVGVCDLPNVKGTQAYTAWNGIIQRCYNKNMLGCNPTYEGVVVSEDWKIFSNFKRWFDLNRVEGWHIDKDILSIWKGKVYSEDTCCFVPPQINSLLLSCTKAYNSPLPQGVILNCTKTRYRARVSEFGKYVCYGTYNTPDEAFEAYRQAKVAHIRVVADIWKDQIKPEVYEMLYKIEPKNPFGYGLIEN